MNYYSSLGVEPTATSAEIKSAYNNLAKKHHPDKGGDETLMQNINDAYDTLGDEKKRKEYDAYNTLGDQKKRKEYDASNSYSSAPQQTREHAETKTKNNWITVNIGLEGVRFILGVGSMIYFVIVTMVGSCQF